MLLRAAFGPRAAVFITYQAVIAISLTGAPDGLADPQVHLVLAMLTLAFRSFSPALQANYSAKCLKQ